MFYDAFNTIQRWIIPAKEAEFFNFPLWLVGMLLTALWALGLSVKFRRSLGEAGGSIRFPAIVGIACMCPLALIPHVRGLVRAIPWLGNLADLILGAALLPVLAVLVGGIIWSVMLLGSWARKVIDLMRIKSDDPTGYDLIDLTLSLFVLALLLNSPELNKHTYFVPAILNAGLGIFSLLLRWPKWHQIRRELELGSLMKWGVLLKGRKAASKEDVELLLQVYAWTQHMLRVELRPYAYADLILDGDESERDDLRLWWHLHDKIRPRIKQQLEQLDDDLQQFATTWQERHQSVEESAMSQ